jgi:UPF0755 protein
VDNSAAAGPPKPATETAVAANAAPPVPAPAPVATASPPSATAPVAPVVIAQSAPSKGFDPSQPLPTGLAPQAPVDPKAVAAAKNGHPSIIDASEGTALDPLKNKTYDLNYAKTVPTKITTLQ